MDSFTQFTTVLSGEHGCISASAKEGVFWVCSFVYRSVLVITISVAKVKGQMRHGI